MIKTLLLWVGILVFSIVFAWAGDAYRTNNPRTVSRIGHELSKAVEQASSKVLDEPIVLER